MPRVKIECPVCGQTIDRQLLECKDHMVSGERFSLLSCSHCQFITTDPLPSEEEMGKYYLAEEYVSHSDTKKGMVNKLYHIIRKRNTKNKLQLVNRQAEKKGTLLDVGCGTGYFLSVCQSDGWQTEGVEVSDIARGTAEERIAQKIYPSIASLLATGKRFDLITLWHVFEHLQDINHSIEALKSLLNTKGTLVLALPNPASYDAAHYQQYWAAYDVPRHLSHFCPATLRTFLEKHDLELIESYPLRFDAYYISMLSEGLKGRGKLTSLLNGFYYGHASNRKASGSKNYSSVVYVIKRKSAIC